MSDVQGPRGLLSPAEREAQGRRSLFRLLGRNLALGLAVGLGLSIAFYVMDVGSLRSLTGKSRDGPFALAIFTIAMLFTFGSFGMGIGVMLHPRGPDYGADMRESRRGEDAGPAPPEG